jgi:hypothetical protein
LPASNEPPANAQAILQARRRAEDDLRRANEALETRTRELAQTLGGMKLRSIRSPTASLSPTSPAGS